ncbi:MAG: cation transporter, partial [Mariprofundus sp.]|nr:cation transporter [Mariprofundus sp.]
MSHGSTKAVLTAIVTNALVTAAKFFGFAVSGSSALLAEAVHSLADTANQALLYLGLRRSARKADAEHQFGYGQEQYFWNLVSAVTIFFLGC